MLIIFLRAIILYAVLLLVMRLMGKRQIGEMQPFEFIITLLIAELACIPMTDVSIPLSYGIVSVLAVFVLHQAMSVIERLGGGVKFAISGKPSVVITPSGVNLEELRKNNMAVGDLVESMRTSGYFRLEDLLYGVFESNGKFSALKNESAPQCRSIPIILIENGKVEKSNLKKLEMRENELIEALSKNCGGQLSSAEDISVLTVDGNGDCYLQLKNSPYETLNIKLKEGVKW